MRNLGFLFLAITLSLGASAQATTVASIDGRRIFELSDADPTFNLPAGSIVRVDFSGNFDDADLNGFTVQNLSAVQSPVTVTLGNTNLFQLPTRDDSFSLLDKTLNIVAPDIPVGEIRVGIRTSIPIRTAILSKETGIPVRMFNLGRVPARDELQARLASSLIRGEAVIRTFLDSGATFLGRDGGLVLGHNGLDYDNSYLWSVVDYDGLFTAGVAAVPLPSTLLLIGSGLGGLFIHRRWRRK